MADLTIAARRQVRLAVLAALEGGGTGAAIQSPGDWDTPPSKLPAILMRAPGDRKEGIAHGQTSFTTTVTVEMEARVEAATAEIAQDALEALCYAIECAILTNHGLISIVQKVVSVDTVSDVTAEGRRQLGGAMMTFVFELVEVFDPFLQSPVQPVAVALEEVQLHQDMLGTYDPSGTYDNPPFPGAVQPAPRLSGPDGRDEGGLDITLPQ
ncbi:hypothetical protein [Janthinobacterium sp.]|uniref:hypothetical protein n=1 Tax=Janthinobacterium sp. TaxID=1871054 RepID=UPI00293D9441|nr:hypothetical protein [Janthinobacterium sp.]